jgi:hypothetical protein
VTLSAGGRTYSHGAQSGTNTWTITIPLAGGGSVQLRRQANVSTPPLAAFADLVQSVLSKRLDDLADEEVAYSGMAPTGVEAPVYGK